MIEPIQIACPLCKALPGDPCKTLGQGYTRSVHEDRRLAASKRRPDPRQLGLLSKDEMLDLLDEAP